MRGARTVVFVLAAGALVGSAPGAFAGQPGLELSLGLVKGDTGHQRFTISEAPESGGAPRTVSFTYRPSPDAHPLTTGDCGATLAVDRGTVLFAPRSASPPFTVSLTLPLGHYLFCEFTAGYAGGSTASTAPADQGVSYTDVEGYAPVAGSKTSVLFNAYAVTPTREKLLGAVGGPTSGVVVVQRQSGKSWVTVSKVRVTRSRWTAVVARARGEVLRAVLQAKAPFSSSTSKSFRVT